MNRSAVFLVLLSLLLLPLTSCANSGFGQALQDSLAADPKLREGAPDGTLTNLTGEQASPQPEAQLPTDFPAEIPRYPNATLQQVDSANDAASEAEVVTRWQSPDGSDRVLAFYREQLQTNGWQLAASPLISAAGTLSAQQNDLTLTITFEPTTSNSNVVGTNFTLRYTQAASASPVAASPSASPSPEVSPSPEATPSSSPQTGAQLEVFLGAEGSSDGGGEIVTLPPNTYTDLAQAPKELRQYLSDLAQLGVLNLAPSGKEKSGSGTFSPNKPVSRREYARWLFEANNRLYGDRSAQQIRPASGVSQAAFRDVPRTDPDFAAIQGLAEAGIIPSSLSGDPTVVTFRPDAQLSRETMLLWKVPIDTRQTLPTANLDTLKQTWGFQDTARIDPKAQRAILADYQNADLSNIRRVFGYTTLFQPKKPVTRAEAAASLWYFGYQGDGVSAQEALKGSRERGVEKMGRHGVGVTPKSLSTSSLSPFTSYLAPLM